MLTYVNGTDVCTRPFEPFGTVNLCTWLLAVAVCGQSIYFVMEAGCLDFTLIDSAKAKVAPYHVGIKKTKITAKNIQVSIFYPMDKGDAASNEYTAMWFDDPDRTAQKLKHAFGVEYFLNLFPNSLLRTMTTFKLPATKDGRLSERFLSGRESLRPVIFSHGVSACNTFYTTVHHAMAAHGYLVIALNHQDGSCFDTEDADGKPIDF